MPEIRLERRGASALKPRGGDRQRVTHDSIVTFTVDPGITGTSIVFDGASPFGTTTVAYNTALRVVAAFNSSDRNKNIFTFRCHGRGPNGEELDSQSGGGEIEIVPGG
jgi:hypothetical protein